jgi:23S rRNA (uracil1939-C5)-methyltransferase
VVETGVVAALTHDGEGIIKVGKTAFVAGALPGETVRFRRTRRHRQHDEAELIEVLERSPTRVEPRCPHFGVCGGCALQHLDTQAQIRVKEAELREVLERVARTQPDRWLAPLQDSVWNYRRRARLGAKYVQKKGRVVIGFRERAAPYIAMLDGCEVLAEPVGALIPALSELLTSLEIRDRVPQIEVAAADNALALVVRVLAPPGAEDLARLRTFEARHGVRLYLQSGGVESVSRLPPNPGTDPGAEEDPLHYRLDNGALRIDFRPIDFIQVHAGINQALLNLSLDLLELPAAASVLDLFCGVGNFTLALARRASEVTGIEGDAGLVDRAQHNAHLNNVENARFYRADLAQPDALSASWVPKNPTHVLLDPPRTGAKELIPGLAKLRPLKLLYVSCHQGSLARDLGMLVHDHGMRLRAAGALDMFPHTAHVESIALLERA